MSQSGIEINSTPELKHPVLIAGFDGWGNALNTATGMVEHLIGQFNAQPFASINPDRYYRFDVSRPLVNINAGRMESIAPPGGEFYAAMPGKGDADLILLSVEEPQLRWYDFVDEILALCRTMGVQTLITLGGMYDNVLHTDRAISGLASNDELSDRLAAQEVLPISYTGPSAIHSVFHQAALKKELNSVSLWCHCPVYIQNVTHYGTLIRLAQVLENLCHIPIEIGELEEEWRKLGIQIQKIVENNPDLQSRIKKIRKEKVKGQWTDSGDISQDRRKVIDLSDFFQPR